MASSLINSFSLPASTFTETLKPSDAAAARSRKVSASTCPALLNFSLPCRSTHSSSSSAPTSTPLQVCDDALKLLQNSPTPQRKAYQKELLLDNLIFFNEALDASRQSGMDIDEDLLSEGDIEEYESDHSEWDEQMEESLSSHLPMSLFVDYQLPLVDNTRNETNCNRQVSKYQRELMLDCSMDVLKQQQGSNDCDCDDLSIGDIESDIEDFDDDIEQDNDHDGVVSDDLCDADFAAARCALGGAPRSTFPCSE
ncbi:MAG: hypothetical protein SGILL_003877 [Bacillariaceae sp.]